MPSVEPMTLLVIWTFQIKFKLLMREILLLHVIYIQISLISYCTEGLLHVQGPVMFVGMILCDENLLYF